MLEHPYPAGLPGAGGVSAAGATTPAARFQGRTMKAAVFHAPGEPLRIEELEIAEPGPGEVLVRLAASGLCHSDYHVIAGEWSVPTPLVLGHEGAGVVEALGSGVAEVAVGDHVVLSWCPNCRRCEYCVSGRPQLCKLALATTYQSVMFDGTTRLRRGDVPVHAFTAVGSFGEYAVVPESGAIRIPDDVPLDRAALVGCAVATGFGAVVNTARVPAGASVAVIGCGGVGLSIIQGARASAAAPVIAIDMNAGKLELARSLGATHTVDAVAEDPVAAVQRITGGRGVDYAFEAIGLSQTIEQAASMLAPAGTTVIVGQAAEGVRISLDPFVISDREHRIIGSNYGSCRPAIDFPRLLGLYSAGRLDLDSLISRRIRLEQIEEGFDAMRAGEAVRTVIVYDG